MASRHGFFSSTSRLLRVSVFSSAHAAAPSPESIAAKNRSATPVASALSYERPQPAAPKESKSNPIAVDRRVDPISRGITGLVVRRNQRQALQTGCG